MVAHLVRLKLTLLRNGLRGDPWRIVAAVIGAVVGLNILGTVVAGLVALRAVDVDVAGAVLTVGGALLLLGWTVVPLVSFGVDDTLDPTRFAPFSIGRRDLVTGMLLAGAVGVPGVVTALLLLATVVTWSRGPLEVAVALLAAPVAALTCVASSRLVTTVAADVLSRRRTREIGAAVVVLALLLLGPALSVAGSRVGDAAPLLREGARVVGWTPLGWAFAAPADVAAGTVGAGVLRLALALGWLVLLLAIWSWGLDRAMVTVTGSGGVRRGRGPGRSWVDRLPATPVGAVTARCLRYWRRDPRCVTNLVGALALPVLLAFAVAIGVMQTGTALLLAGPLLGGILGWGQGNDVAYDGTAIWTHVAAGIPGTADRWGRTLAVLVWAAPLTVVATVAGVAFADRWALLPAMLGISVALLGAGSGVSAVCSVALPYPVPEPGANPFSSRPGGAVASLVGQAVSSGATIGLVAPTALATVLALRGVTAASWVALVLGVTTAGVCLVLGVRLGGALFERRGPALISAMRR